MTTKSRFYTNSTPAALRHPFLTLLLFAASYFITITVNAQDTVVTGDTVQVQSNRDALITGTITVVEDDHFDMDSNGKLMRVSLKNVNMKNEADTVFTKGMNVSVQGEMSGDDFGVPIIKATNVVASNSPTATIIDDNALPRTH